MAVLEPSCCDGPNELLRKILLGLPEITAGGGIDLQTNSVSNANQDILNLINGTGILITTDGSGNITIASTTPSGSGTTNFVSKWTSPSVLGNSTIFDDGTFVGVGTATPGYKLEVNGSARIDGIVIDTVPGGAGNINVGGTIGGGSDRSVAFAGSATGTLATAIGLGAISTNGGTAIGGYTTSAANGIAISNGTGGAVTNNRDGVAIGYTAEVYGEGIGLYGNVGTNISNSVGIAIKGSVVGGLTNGSIAMFGYAGADQSVALRGSTTAVREFVVGAAYADGDMTNFAITNVFFGSGKARFNTAGIQKTGAGIDYAINGSGAFGTDFAGGNITLASGKGTGSGAPGEIIFSTSTALGTGTTLQSLTERARLTANGSFGLGLTPTAVLNIKAGTATASTAPLKFTTGTNMSTAEAGAMEYTNPILYFTPTGTVRGVVEVEKSSRSTGQTGANASVFTYTLTATDASFRISANVLVTTSSAENFTVTCAYTDEGNTARTQTIPFVLLAGTVSGVIAFANGAVPYEGVVFRIRCKASTTITIATTGTFTGCTYNVEGGVSQVA